MARTKCFHCQDQNSIPSQGTKIPQATWHAPHKKKKKKERKKKSSTSRIIGIEPSHKNSKSIVLPHYTTLYSKGQLHKLSSLSPKCSCTNKPYYLHYPLEKGMATHSPGESPWTEELGALQSMASQRVGHD